MYLYKPLSVVGVAPGALSSYWAASEQNHHVWTALGSYVISEGTNAAKLCHTLSLHPIMTESTNT
jgi:hypothetical protein